MPVAQYSHCIKGGNMDIWIAIVMALGFTFFALWKMKTWIFYVAGIIWVVLCIFAFKDYATTDMGWYFGWIYGAIALVCISAGVWLSEKKTSEDDPRDVRFRERQEKIDKKKNEF